MIAFIKRHLNAKQTEIARSELIEMLNAEFKKTAWLNAAYSSLRKECDSLRRENVGFKSNIKELFAGLELIANKLDEMARQERENELQHRVEHAPEPGFNFKE